MMRNGVLAAVVVVIGWAGACLARPAELRGIWMHGTQIKTSAEADACVEKIARAKLNAAFVLVWYWGGQAFFQSDLAPMADGVAAGYDPLGYLVEKCHARGIEVHAWFVNGSYGAGSPRHVVDRHPDWLVDSGAGGQLWYDFGKPEVRRFQSDLMIECLRKYDLDGIHFDYIRYGPHECYCSHCQTEFSRQYGFEPITPQRRVSYPVCTTISANRLGRPTTAQVLAEFSDGVAAIALNKLGAGRVLLLNWHAETEMPPAVALTVRRFVGYFAKGTSTIHVATTAETRKEYGGGSYTKGANVVRNLGGTAKGIDEDAIADLPGGAVLMLPAVYTIGEKTAGAIEAFVRRGGLVIFLDGPVKSMRQATIQRVTGFAGTAGYISREDIIRATSNNYLAPQGSDDASLDELQRRKAKWAEYRKAGVTALVQDVYRRAKALKPKADVTAAVFCTFEAADNVYQDWPRWLRERTIDYVIPMAYTSDTAELARQIAQWKTLDPTLSRIVPGLCIYTKTEAGTVPRSPSLVAEQRRLCRREGADGNLFFSLHTLSDELIALLSSGN